MYFYVFDPGRDREVKYFERIQGRLLNLLAENHIEGETYRVTAIRSIDLLVDQALGADTKTIVVVGSDASLNKAINSLVRKQADLTVGFIPLDEESSSAKILGLPVSVDEAVKIIASRLTTTLDLGKVGEHYFLSQVDLGPNPFTRIETGFWGVKAARQLMNLNPFTVKLSLENSYSVTSEALGVQIINSRNNEGCRLKLGNPTDKLLDLLLLHKLKAAQIIRYRNELASGSLDNVPGTTVMHAKKIEVQGPRKLPISIEGQVYTKAPATISVAKEKIKIIVGKNRQF